MSTKTATKPQLPSTKAAPGLETLRFDCVGEPKGIIMHNCQLADPLNEYAKAIKKISGKRKKTESDHLEMARLEFLGGLYLNTDRQVVIPCRVIEAAIHSKGGSARMEKEGPRAKRGLFAPEDALLVYAGPKDPDGLWEEESFRHRESVVVGPSRLMRTRPIFYPWETTVKLCFNPSVVNREEVIRWMISSGRNVGWCERRPTYGRFEATLVEG